MTCSSWSSSSWAIGAQALGEDLAVGAVTPVDVIGQRKLERLSHRGSFLSDR
jgi:hypothetical protein